MEIEPIKDFKGYGRCLRIYNGAAELVATLDKGPRIVSYALCGGENILFDRHEELKDEGDAVYAAFFGDGRKWNSFGGHRLWRATEAWPQTYYPDCAPVNYAQHDGGVTLTPPVQTENGVQMRLTVRLGRAAEVTLTHEIENVSEQAQTYSVWPITVMRKGGVEIIPLNTRDTGLLPNRHIAVWPYADLQDERFRLGRRFAILRQTPKKGAFKIGFNSEAGCAYYACSEMLFRKQFPPHTASGCYADGVAFETYTNETILEIESLSEHRRVDPGAVLTYTETWNLTNTKRPFVMEDEDAIERFLLEAFG